MDRTEAARVLVVEDDPDCGFLLVEALQADGYEAALAGPFDAVAAALRLRPAVILMDYLMPPTDGGAILAAIREHLPDVPAILVTAIHNAAETAERLGVRHCLSKPFDLVDLTTLVAAVLATTP